MVDDGSVNETPGVLRRLVMAHPKVLRFLHTDNQGPGAAREVGRQHAQGEYSQYLDSDDLFSERKFELRLSAIQSNSECGVTDPDKLADRAVAHPQILDHAFRYGVRRDQPEMRH